MAGQTGGGKEGCCQVANWIVIPDKRRIATCRSGTLDSSEAQCNGERGPLQHLGARVSRGPRSALRCATFVGDDSLWLQYSPIITRAQRRTMKREAGGIVAGAFLFDQGPVHIGGPIHEAG
jgi:hypothetical protein